MSKSGVSSNTSSEEIGITSSGGQARTGTCCGLWDHALESYEYHFKITDRIRQRMARENETWDDAFSKLKAEWSVHDQLNRDLPDFEAPQLDAGATKSVAFMFLTTSPLNREDVWVPWFESAPRDQYDIVVHNDKGGSIGALGSLARPVDPPTMTGWATSGLVRATILLLREALKTRSNTHFVLLSNSDIPLFSFAEFYSKVMAKTKSRFHRMDLNWDESLGRNVWQRPSVSPLFAEKGLNSKADQWSMWTREDAAFFATNNFLKNLRPRALFVDEQYFIQMMHTHRRKHEDLHVTFTKWKFAADSPVTFTDEVSDAILTEARSCDAWFLRKVVKDARLPNGYMRDLGIDAA
mmetsp:Transcript_19433/g.51968  ORF Transcript_19433/g.51968 Transcript_19433/m.51968 type:complete len:352 (+) Transcript_19433:299-1354(+)